MNTFRHDPEGAANASATEQNKREVRALQAAHDMPHVGTCGAVQDAGRRGGSFAAAFGA